MVMIWNGKWTEDGPGELKKNSAESQTRHPPTAESGTRYPPVSAHEQMTISRLSTAGYQGRVSSHLISRAPSVSESGVSMQETDEEEGYDGDGEAEDVARLVATATSAGLFVDGRMSGPFSEWRFSAAQH